MARSTGVRRMTSHVGRLYALAGTLVIFFVLWAAIATHPWTSAPADPRLTVLAKREQALRREAVLVNRIVAQRAALQRAEARKQAQAAPTPALAPKVRVVTLPPLTITRTS
jgi:hypothetical protein